MISWLLLVLRTLGGAARSHLSLSAENAILRQQLDVLQRGRPRPFLRPTDRVMWIWLARHWSRWRYALVLIQPATVLNWHREGYRRYWRRRSSGPGRPRIPQDHIVDAAISNNWLPAVINISAGTDNSGTAQKINDAFDDGILVITGAGNDNIDAYGDSGNRAYGSLVVGATNISDERWEWDDTTGSNWGSTVDLMAPGEYVVTAKTGGDTVAASGTSMASPFTAGVAALILENNTSMSPTLLKEVLVESAWPNELDGGTLEGSPNLLLNSISFWIDDYWSGPTFVPEPDEGVGAWLRSE